MKRSDQQGGFYSSFMHEIMALGLGGNSEDGVNWINSKNIFGKLLNRLSTSQSGSEEEYV